MRPTYDLRIGTLSATDASPTGGTSVLAVDRDVDVALDVARIRLANRSGVAVGDRCTLALGMDGDPERVFTGAVVEVRVDVVGATVVAVGAMSALLDLRATATYTQTTLGSIARDLSGRVGLTLGDVVEGPSLPWFVLDVRRSAHGQLRDLANRFGVDLFADRDGALVLRELPGGGPGAGIGGSALPAVSSAVTVPAGAGGGAGLRFGAELVDAVSWHRQAPWEAVTVGGESPASARGASAATWLTADADVSQGQSGSGGRRLVLVDPLARTKDLARDLADGVLRFTGRGARVLEVTTPGRAGTELGESVVVGVAAGRPDRLLEGTGHVRRLLHRFDRSGFTTRIGVALPAPTPEVGP